MATSSVTHELADFYVGIGASAGGLEALKSLFDGLPSNSGAAFIVIQHLSPDFDSVMDELLSKVTNLRIRYIEDGMPIEKNTLYLNTPRSAVSVSSSGFVVMPALSEQKPAMPIDNFFWSLGSLKKDKCIAIVLSGTGSDGSRGIQAVKEGGGFIIVQDPEDAKFNGMPLSSINTGLADLVLPIFQIQEKLIHFIHKFDSSSQNVTVDSEEERDDELLLNIFELLKEQSGIDFSQYKPSTVSRRIERRVNINQFSTLAEYSVFLQTKPEELEVLNKDLLIGVTSFFRDKEAFEVLHKEVLPELIKNTPSNEVIRFWVAGCSRGDEAYSLAIALHRTMKELDENRSVKIFATDVDGTAIAEAGLGSYSLSIAEELEPDILQDYFDLEAEQYVVKPLIRRMIIFAVHNLLKDPPFSNIHLASCRNVLIYFRQSVQRRVLASLQFSLVKDGYLVLGSSESLSEAQKCYTVIDERHRIFRKIDNHKPHVTALTHSSNGQRYVAPRAPSFNVLMKAHRGSDRELAYKPVVEKLLGQFLPPSLVVDENTKVVHVYGDISPYCRPPGSGQFSSEIRNIIMEELFPSVSSAIHNAIEQRRNFVYENINLQTEKLNKIISLRVTFVDSEYAGERYVILSFEDQASEPGSMNYASIPFDEAQQNRQLIKDLESQLKSKQEHLQVTIEELETTNEELQASNEELMASNEELQSTNEELQSVNEELYTVNSEFQEKISEITQANLDLDNLLESSETSIIFLDDALMIRHFTPPTVKHVNLLPSDIGRPFHHISHKLNYPSLLDDLSLTIQDADVRSKETRNKDGMDIILRILPYFGEQKEVLGCVISLTDISELKGLERSLDQTQQTLRSLLQIYQKNNQLITPNIKLLIFDDDPDDIAIIEHQINRISHPVEVTYEVLKASSPSQAKEVLEQQNIQVCLIDFRLGELSAVDFIQQCDPDLHKRCAFILITGAASEEVNTQAMREGVIDSIAKEDLSPSLLRHVINTAVRALAAVSLAR